MIGINKNMALLNRFTHRFGHQISTFTTFIPSKTAKEVFQGVGIALGGLGVASLAVKAQNMIMTHNLLNPEKIVVTLGGKNRKSTNILNQSFK